MPKKVVDTNIINLIKNGLSINKIIDKTGLGKSTIYYHYKKIRGRKTKKVEFKFKNNEELGEFLGIFAGDGSFYRGEKHHYNIRIYTGYYEKGYIEYLKKVLVKWFCKKPHVYKHKYMNKISALRFSYDSKEIYLLLKEYLFWEGKKTYTIKLKNFDINSKDLNLGFLRGLIDTDGNYYAPKRRLSFSTVSKELSQQVQNIMVKNLNVIPNLNVIKSKKSNRVPLYTLSLHGINAKRVIDTVKPSNPNKTYAVVVER